jgi:LmbE family N-acetylglucosaminyl deacetylase
VIYLRYVRELILICAIFALLSPLAGHAAAVEITDRVKFKASTGSAAAATDDLMTTAWAPGGDEAELYMEFPDGGAGYVRLDWEFDSPGYEFVQYGADRKELASRDESDSYAGITQLFPVVDGARYAMIRLTKPGQKICKVKVYSKGELPEGVLNFDPPFDKCDLMVVSAHQDDEFIYFGGIIPYYIGVRGKKVQVVYMADCSRLRRGEALNGLWAVGERNYPDFINQKDKRVDTIKKGVELWGGKDAILSKLVWCIRRYKPDVILTHDLDGEYGHNQHKITANAMKLAIEAAADPAQYPDSYAQYGAWQVKKLYLHLYSEDVIDFDWNAPHEELGGRTPLDLARAGFAKHVSQQKYYRVEDGGKYDNSLFGLAYSVVGEDARHDDLFENIDAAEPTADTAAEPTREPALFFSPEPTPVSTVAPQACEDVSATAMRTALILGGGIALIGAISVAQVASYRKKRRRRR